MKTNDDKQNVDPKAMLPDELARILGLSPNVVSRHIGDGLPTNSDGTINLVHYAAWLNTAPGETAVGN